MKNRVKLGKNKYRIYINSSTVLTADEMFQIATQEKRNEVFEEASKVFHKNASKEEYMKYVNLMVNSFKSINSYFDDEAKTLLDSTKDRYTVDEILIMMMYYPKEEKFKEKFDNFCKHASVDDLKQLRQKMKDYQMVK